MDGPIPQNYDEWRHCITVECGIPLTLKFIEERLASMRDANDFRTKQFAQLYGPAHLQNVMSWFEQAKNELAAA